MKKNNVFELVAMSTLLAIIIVLQLISGFITINGVSITLALIPIVVGGVLFGPKKGIILGTAFGLVVLIQSIVGVEPTGALLWNINPVYTLIIIMSKAILAGFVPAIVYKSLANKNKILAIIVASILAPIVNTSMFLIGMFTFFYNVLQTWAAGENVIIYALTFLVAINFIVEFSINTILSPVIVRIVKVIRKEE